MLHACVDIETAGDTPDSIILSIGAVLFTAEGGIIDRFYVAVDLDQPGRRCTFTTVRWWSEQDDGVREDAWHARPRQHLFSALALLAGWLKRRGPVKRVWCMPGFDHTLLQHAWAQGQAAGALRRHDGAGTYPTITGPFSPIIVRDVRTVRDILRFVGAELPEHTGRKHHALDDAEHEAELVLLWLRLREQLRGKFAPPVADPAQCELNFETKLEGSWRDGGTISFHDGNTVAVQCWAQGCDATVLVPTGGPLFGERVLCDECRKEPVVAVEKSSSTGELHLIEL